MKRLIIVISFALLVVVGISTIIVSCDTNSISPSTVSDSGVEKASVEVVTNVNGHTIEQENIMERYKRDNLPGSIKHLYVISAESGQVLIYSTVKGKVTSSGKRLTPTTINNDVIVHFASLSFQKVRIGNNMYVTDEVLQDDGTYGSSIEYLYWFDSKGIYHQHYKGGNEILHVSDQPLAVKSIILNLEAQ